MYTLHRYIAKHIRVIFYKIKSYTVVLTLLLLFGLCCYIYQQCQTEPPEETSSGPRKSTETLAYECCTPLNITMNKHIFFLKTHKTGGSTVQNVIFRFADRYSLDIMFPFYYFYYHPLSIKSLVPNTVTPNNKYHVLAYHMRYTSKLKSYQYRNTRMVTILRHPATLFHSIYEYFRMPDFMGMTFQQFLTSPTKPKKLWGIQSESIYRGYNQMSVDLGLDVENHNNKTAINQFIEKIDREFDFVMIMEYMDASMVLLANLMGWPLEYMVHLKTNARPPVNSNQYKLTQQDESILLQLNQVDALLYHHFLQKFRKCVREYGVDKLGKQILKLQKMNKQLTEKCVAGVNFEGLWGAVNYIPKNATDWECNQALKLQVPFELELNFRQDARIRLRSSKTTSVTNEKI